MDELHRRGQTHMTVAVIAAGLGRRQGQQRAQALAAGIDQMPRQIGDQLDAGRHALMDQLVGGLHVGGDQRIQPLDRGYPGLAPTPHCLP